MIADIPLTQFDARVDSRKDEHAVGKCAIGLPRFRSIREWKSSTTWRAILVCCSLTLLTASPAWGQETSQPAASPATPGVNSLPSSLSNPPPATTTPGSVPETKKASTLDEAGDLGLPRKVEYLKDDQGRLVRVLRDARLKSFLDYLSTDDAPRRPVTPQWAVSSVEMTGSADEQFATLQTRIQVLVSQSDQAVLVPLGLSEGVILESKLRGPAVPVYAGKDAALGYRWWLSGTGTYEFELKLLVPIRRGAPWRRLQLTLPVTPIASLLLEIPDASPVTRVPEEVALESKAVEGNRTQLRAWGFGNRVDLQWQSTIATTDQKATLDANTTLLVRNSGSAYLIEATQYIKALQGVFREFTVQLPAGSELLRVEAADMRETRTDPANPQRITVEFNSAVSGTSIVKWSVRLPQLPSKRTILEGFSVEQARRQSGEIGLLAPEGARWTISDSLDSRLERMSAGELRTALGGSNVVRAYRFFGQPFSLPLELHAVEPFFDIRPQLVIYASNEELRLEARYDIRTFSGQLNELRIHWPGWKADGWRLESVQPPGSVVTGISAAETSDSSQIVMSVSDAAPRNFELRLGARCAISQGDLKVSLPKLVGPSTTPAQVIFLHAEPVDAELIATGETALHQVTSESHLKASDVGFPAGLPLQQFRLESEERTIQVKVTPQPQQVTTRNLSQVSMTGRRLSIQQRLDVTVNYQRMSEVPILVPASLSSAIQFFQGEQELLPRWKEGDRPREQVAILQLPEASIGDVRLMARWAQPLPEELWSNKSSPITIPVLMCRTGKTVENRLEFSRPTWFAVSAGDSAWQLEHADDTLSRWSAGSGVNVFDGVLSPSNGEDGPHYLVSKASVEISATTPETQTYRVRIRMSGSGPHLNIQLPEKAAGVSFAWNGEAISDIQYLEFPAGSRRYTLSWPNEATTLSERLLELEYRLPGQSLQGISALVKTSTPQFPQCDWAARVLWQIDIPENQHLFVPPVNAECLLKWRRDGLTWSRQPLVPADELHQWMGATPSLDVVEAAPGLHRYTFSQLGVMDDLKFRLLSTPATFLLGAGISLAAGFLMIKIPACRSLLASLAIVWISLVLALSYQPQVELLLQPMFLGVFLVALLGLQDWWRQRRQQGTVLTFSPAGSEVSVAPLEGSGTHSLVVRGTDSATIFRDPSNDGSRTTQPAESHAG